MLAATMEACAGVARGRGQRRKSRFTSPEPRPRFRASIDSPLSQTDLDLLEAKPRLGETSDRRGCRRRAFEEGKGLRSGDAISIALDVGSKR